MDHSITVADLKSILEQLESNDVLIPNAVGNLAIIRNEEIIGYVDLAEWLSVGERLRLHKDED
jgi:hypothetical protein